MPFVAVVSFVAASQPMRMKLDLVSGHTPEAITKWAKASLLPKSMELSDGLASFAALIAAGCAHTPRVVEALKPRNLLEFKWIKTWLDNIKATLNGLYIGR